MPLADVQPNTVAIIGVPFDENSSFLRGSATAPKRIREVFYSDATNLCAENGLDLGAATGWQDLGDVEFAPGVAVFNEIEDAVTKLLKAGVRVLSLGGDHSITYPIVRAYAPRYPELAILQLDAHPDLYDEYEGNRHSHACPFARIKEEQLVRRLVQVGIRTMNSHQREQAERFGVEVIEMRAWQGRVELEVDGPIYVSVDMDVLDPAYAPGVSHPEAGGFTTREVLGIIQQLRGRIVGADVVEFNPTRDPAGVTAVAAAKLMKEILARMLE